MFALRTSQQWGVITRLRGVQGQKGAKVVHRRIPGGVLHTQIEAGGPFRIFSARGLER